MKNTERAEVRFSVTKTNASQLFRKVLRREITMDEFRKSEIIFRTAYEIRDVQIIRRQT